MMMLIFKVNDKRYGINVREIVEVVPYVPLQVLPGYKESVAGLLNYRGDIVPVIDSSVLIGDRPVKQCMSSRIIMVFSERMRKSCIGFLAEGVTDTVRIDDSKFTETTIGDAVCNLVNKVVLDGGGMIQHINTKSIISDDLKVFMKSDETDINSMEDELNGV